MCCADMVGWLRAVEGRVHILTIQHHPLLFHIYNDMIKIIKICNQHNVANDIVFKITEVRTLHKTLNDINSSTIYQTKMEPSASVSESPHKVGLSKIGGYLCGVSLHGLINLMRSDEV